MARWVFNAATWTPTPQADGVLTGPYMALTGGSSTQVLRVNEIFLGGQAAASAVNAMTFARSSTVGITPTALAAPNANAPLNSDATPLSTSPVAYVAATTAPNRSPTAAYPRLTLAFNPWGGIVCKFFAPGEEWVINGNAVNVSESTLSAINVSGAGLMGSHIEFEPL